LEQPKADLQKNDEGNDLDGTVEQVQEEVVELGLGLGGQLLEPDARREIQEFGDV